MEDLESVIIGIVPEDELVTHFEVIISTRRGDAAEQIRYHRLSTPGSDPALSLGLLTAMCARLERQLAGG